MPELALLGGEKSKSRGPARSSLSKPSRRITERNMASLSPMARPRIEVVMAAFGIGPGDEVIIPDFTFVATASAVLFAGAMPVMADVSADTHSIDPLLAEAAITPRTKAIIAVRMGGHSADLDRLGENAAKHKLALVEDSSHAHSTEWRNRRIGTFGSASAFTFQSSKLMTAGEGGIIITSDDQVERIARSVHDCGRMPREWFYSHYMYGSNYRLSEWQGAVLHPA